MVSMDNPREVAARLAKEAFAKCRGKLFFLPDDTAKDIDVVASEILAIGEYIPEWYVNRIYTPEADLVILGDMCNGWIIDVTKDIQKVDSKFKGRATVHINHSECFYDNYYSLQNQYEGYGVYVRFTRFYGSPDWILDRFRGNA